MFASSHARPQSIGFRSLIARVTPAFAAAVTVLLAASAVAQARVGTPGLQSPRNGTVVQSLPAFTWDAVGGATSYEFEFSAVRNFSSGVNGFGNNPISLSNTAVTNDQTIPNGTYYWRVRAVNAKDVPGRWSPIRKLVKRWNAAPKLRSPLGSTIDWPTSPLMFSWAPVAHAVNYRLEIGTSPKMSTLVYGPTDVQGPHFAFPGALAPNTYYWSVQPIDAAGNLGTSSAVAKFTWAWPSQTTLSETDVSPDSTYEEPSFSWTAVPGAASYELEVSTDPSYPQNAIILDSTGLTGTQYTPSSFFPNHTTLYWRLRAIDSTRDAGSWNIGEPFTEDFDQISPPINNFHLVDQNGTVIDGATTSDPILRWSPVPGASNYALTFVPWVSGQGCLYNDNPVTMDTPLTSWTPGASTNASWEGVWGWPGSVNAGTDGSPGTGNYCVSLLAYRTDSPIEGATIASAPVILGGSSAPAFDYSIPTVSGTLSASATVDYSPGLVSPSFGGGALSAGSSVPTAPLFEWQPVANATGYYVVIASNAYFDPNSIVVGGYTDTTAWAPPVWLQDQTSTLYWEVIPVNSNQDSGAPLMDPEGGDYNPQPFTKNSIPPTPVSPVDDANVPTVPVFSWKSAQGAANYTIEIATDNSFANPIETDTTDSTTITATSTLPAGKTLFWRVRANDPGYNLNWSAVETFTHNLPAPGSLQSSPKTGSTIPVLSWSPVTGAVGYNLQITAGGSSSVVAVDTPYMTPSEFLNPGISHLQIQSVFPGGLTSAYSPIATFDRTIPAPSGIHASKRGTRILVSWKTDPLAKAYSIQLSTTTDFGSPIASDTTDNTAWVPQISATDARLRLYWRLAAVDQAGNTGAWHTGVFNGRHAKATTKHKAGKHPTKKKKHKH